MELKDTKESASPANGTRSRHLSFAFSSANSRDQTQQIRHPKQYVTAISNHSKRSQESHLYPGINYRALALFLSSWRERGLIAPKQRPTTPSKFDFVIVHDLYYAPGDPKRITTFDSVDGMPAFSSHPLPTNQSGQLVFLRGHPSKEWINTIGARYRINPELFRRQLPFDSSSPMFDLPGLPSSVPNTIRLPLLSLGKPNVSTCNRSQAGSSMRQYLDKLGASPGLVGESIVRRFNAHDGETFSIEQDVTVTVLRRGDGWIAVILLDVGRDLKDGPDGPWFSSEYQSSLEHIFHPVFQLEPRMCFVDNSDLTFNPPVDDTLTGSAINICCQSASLLSTSLYGRLLDPEIMRLDALYAMHGLFTFALSAENQFLNCLRTKLKADSRRMNDSSRLHEILQNCIYHRGILRGRIDRLRAIEEAVLERGGPRWPSLKAKKAVLVESAGAVSQNTSNGLSSIGATLQRDEALATFQKQMTAVEAADASLLQDCSALLRKAEELLRLYKESIHDIRTTTSVLETQRAFEQSATVGRLTFLAFMFIPLSFTTSFFGMNFQDLGSGSGGKQLRIWVWFVVTIPVFACALVLLYWPSLVSVYQKLRIRKKAK